jgi:hypothetical protein
MTDSPEILAEEFSRLGYIFDPTIFGSLARPAGKYVLELHRPISQDKLEEATQNIVIGVDDRFRSHVLKRYSGTAKEAPKIVITGYVYVKTGGIIGSSAEFQDEYKRTWQTLPEAASNFITVEQLKMAHELELSKWFGSRKLQQKGLMPTGLQQLIDRQKAIESIETQPAIKRALEDLWDNL